MEVNCFQILLIDVIFYFFNMFKRWYLTANKKWKPEYMRHRRVNPLTDGAKFIWFFT